MLLLSSLGSFPPFFLVSSAATDLEASKHTSESATSSSGTNASVASHTPTMPLGGSAESKEQGKHFHVDDWLWLDYLPVHHD